MLGLNWHRNSGSFKKEKLCVKLLSFLILNIRKHSDSRRKPTFLAYSPVKLLWEVASFLKNRLLYKKVFVRKWKSFEKVLCHSQLKNKTVLAWKWFHHFHAVQTVSGHSLLFNVVSSHIDYRFEIWHSYNLSMQVKTLEKLVKNFQL